MQKFSPAGVSLATFGTGGTGNGQFQAATGVAVDGGGNVYACDLGGNRIEKFTSTGAFIGAWGGLGSAAGQLNNPNAVACDALGNVYVADSFNFRMQQFRSIADAPGSYMFVWGSTGALPGQFQQPYGIQASPWGFVYVADLANNRIQYFSNAGGYLGSWGTFGSANGQFFSPAGVVVDPAGYLYVSDSGNNRIQKFDSGGVFQLKWGTAGSGTGQFHQPSGLAIDAFGSLYVADQLNNRIQKFSGSGVFLQAWGGLGGGFGVFNGPKGVAVDADGFVHVMDSGNNLVQKFNSAGTFVKQWGGSGTGDGQFNLPVNAAIDASGFLYITDANNNRVQKFGPTGTFITKWGVLGLFANQFWSPVGIAIDAVGSLYVTEYLGNRVQKVASPPTIDAISDVGNDQGRWSRIRIARCSADALFSGLPVTGYEVYRQVVPGTIASPANAGPVPVQVAGPASAQLAGWEQIATIAAHGESEYDVVVPTLMNANATSAGLTTFMVRAATADPYTFYDSGANLGWSVDNLSPPAPAPFAAAMLAGVTHLHWGLSPASDFSRFNLYKGTSAAFVPGAGNLVTATVDTGYTDTGTAGGYYKLSAVDFEGNESPFALVSPGTTLDAPATSLPREVELTGATPNPVSAGGTLRYGLPRATRVRLSLYDVSGREVRRLEDGVRAAGWHTLRWDGEGGNGRRLGAGVFFLKLSAEGRDLTRRVVALE